VFEEQSIARTVTQERWMPFEEVEGKRGKRNAA
jgi:hypothetical protein